LSSGKHILLSEIDNWRLFARALREENRILFNQMLSECMKKEYYDSVNNKGKSFSAESLFLILLLEQQKMIVEQNYDVKRARSCRILNAATKKVISG
jgi:hypothetical protein